MCFQLPLRGFLGRNLHTVSAAKFGVDRLFSGWVESCVVGYVEEMRAAYLEGASQAAYEMMKARITDVDATVRRMRQDDYTVPNRMNLLMLCNEAGAVHIPKDETRRFCVLGVLPDAQELTPVEGRRLTGLITSPDGVAAIIAYLRGLSPDVVGDLEGNPPRTERLEVFQEASRPAAERLIIEAVYASRYSPLGETTFAALVRDGEVITGGDLATAVNEREQAGAGIGGEAAARL